ncbi:alpha/beta fold hydrolase [Hyphococcus luteus]|uniref:AB hydrolase-1 domain-containing protein n=1 Tax=Hyphococcus luteus TaxID=2058213 RepID=A0A2S7JZJ9_9PROT|nr:alpha/beta hydrolase [Marinicaulis flavus]PQA85628.1 hypothetical protein CW354_22105 [Marinicaulis flavus]
MTSGDHKHSLLLKFAAAALALSPIAPASAAEGDMVGGLARKTDRPLENMDGFSSDYGVAETSDGARLRTIITRPDGAGGRLHPLLFTQWVSCGSLEFRNGDNILASLAKNSGLALARVERASDGDSVGPACDDLDYDTEVAHYIEAFSQVLEDDRFDPSKVYLYGSSLGSTTAPLVAKALQDQGYNIAGVAVQGGGAETYYERMLTFDRHYLERRPADVAPEDIHDEMIARARFHYEYLIKDRHPDMIAKDSARMAAVRADILGLGETDHYGRPFAWHQQAAKRNFLAAWAALDAPVLVIFNEYDQFEARYGHQLITDMVNRLRPGTGTLVEQKGVGHSNYRYDDIVSAYPREGGEPVWAQTADVILNWLEDVQK